MTTIQQRLHSLKLPGVDDLADSLSLLRVASGVREQNRVAQQQVRYEQACSLGGQSMSFAAFFSTS